eukprot:jgi/Mesvir1/23137/Mv10529-RA.3
MQPHEASLGQGHTELSDALKRHAANMAQLDPMGRGGAGGSSVQERDDTWPPSFRSMGDLASMLRAMADCMEVAAAKEKAALREAEEWKRKFQMAVASSAHSSRASLTEHAAPHTPVSPAVPETPHTLLTPQATQPGHTLPPGGASGIDAGSGAHGRPFPTLGVPLSGSSPQPSVPPPHPSHPSPSPGHVVSSTHVAGGDVGGGVDRGGRDAPALGEAGAPMGSSAQLPAAVTGTRASAAETTGDGSSADIAPATVQLAPPPLPVGGRSPSPAPPFSGASTPNTIVVKRPHRVRVRQQHGPPPHQHHHKHRHAQRHPPAAPHSVEGAGEGGGTARDMSASASVGIVGESCTGDGSNGSSSGGSSRGSSSSCSSSSSPDGSPRYGPGESKGDDGERGLRAMGVGVPNKRLTGVCTGTGAREGAASGVEKAPGRRAGREPTTPTDRQAVLGAGEEARESVPRRPQLVDTEAQGQGQGQEMHEPPHAVAGARDVGPSRGVPPGGGSKIVGHEGVGGAQLAGSAPMLAQEVSGDSMAIEPSATRAGSAPSVVSPLASPLACLMSGDASPPRLIRRSSTVFASKGVAGVHVARQNKNNLFLPSTAPQEALADLHSEELRLLPATQEGGAATSGAAMMTEGPLLMGSDAAWHELGAEDEDGKAPSLGKPQGSAFQLFCSLDITRPETHGTPPSAPAPAPALPPLLRLPSETSDGQMVSGHLSSVVDMDDGGAYGGEGGGYGYDVLGGASLSPRTGKEISNEIIACSSMQIVWEKPPKSVLLVCKPGKEVEEVLASAIRWLHADKHLLVLVEPSTYAALGEEQRAQVLTWDVASNLDKLHVAVDFIVTFGGDGTVIWTSSLFAGPMPPTLAMAMGSLGFLTAFPLGELQPTVEHILRGGFSILLRHRLTCRILRAGTDDGRDSAEENSTSSLFTYSVLNEVVVDRGLSPFLTNLECFCDDAFVTNVQGDGLIVSTPSGSTAYSLAAGGSMVHPQVPAILFTPICPHSLSFRPLIFPDYVTLRVQVPAHARGTAWVSFDGKNRQQLGGGDAVLVRMSVWPMPSVCRQGATPDWFRGVRDGLNWNVRKQQAKDGLPAST